MHNASVALTWGNRPGVMDKRLLVTEFEFPQALRTAARPGNTLSATVRGMGYRQACNAHV